MASLEELAFETEREIGTTRAFFPILPALGNRWAARRPWEGRTVGLNLHLTPPTASLVLELMLGGATCVLSAANPGTTTPGVVQLLRNAGAEVYTGGDLEDRHQQVLSHSPSLLVDVGFSLTATAIDRPGLGSSVQAAIETTRSGVLRLRERAKLPFPVVNLHDGRLADVTQNRHGLGESVWESVSRLTDMHLAGRRVAVLGYGPVGRSLAAWGRNAGMAVEVVESDPVRRLFAHYDGFPTPTLRDALSRARFVVTATGTARALPVEALATARDRVVLLNAGTGGDEIDVSGIVRSAERVDHVAEGVVLYRLETGRTVIVLGNGHPLNIVLNAGSPEPLLVHFALLGLTLEWLVGARLSPGEHSVPHAVEEDAARAALGALDIAEP